jgi:hypothetical protein
MTRFGEQVEDYTCDVCGKPWLFGEALYSIATNETTRKMRHWECNTPVDKALDNLRQSIKNAENALGAIRKVLK